MKNISVIIAVAAFLVAGLAQGAEQPTREFRLPGNCVKTITQDVKAGTEKVTERCEYTEKQRARMAKEGN